MSKILNSKFTIPNSSFSEAAFDEAALSQIPAVLELLDLGYTYLSCETITSMREGESQYVLREIANRAMRAINQATVSDKSLRDAAP